MSATRTTATTAIPACSPATCAAPTTTSRRSSIPSGWNGARGRSRVSGALIPTALLERSLAGEARFRARLNCVFDRPRRGDHACHRHPAAPYRALQARGASVTLNAVAGMVPYNGVWNLTGQPARAVPAGFGPDGLPLGGADRRTPGRRGDAAGARGALEAERPWAEHARPGSVERGRLAAGARRRGRPARRRLLLERVASRRRARRVAARARRPTSSARPTSPLSGRSVSCSRARRPRRRVSRRGGRRRGGHERPALDRRPARRHRQLPLRDPAVVVSVAVADDEGTVAGAVYDPNRDELFSTRSRGGRARRFDRARRT